MLLQEAISWPWTPPLLTVTIFSLAFLLQSWLRKTTTTKTRLPPGPEALPILGHLHLIGKSPHIDLHHLAKKHGPIMLLRFGFVPNVIVSSPQAAEQFLKTHDLVFASRPPHEGAKYLLYEQRNLSFAPYGAYWRNMRKLCTLELFSSLKIASFQPMRKEEVGLLIEAVNVAATDRVAVDVSAKVSSMSADVSCRMVCGKKYNDEEFNERGFKAVIQEGMQLAAAPNLGDYFPYIGALDLQGLTKRMKNISKIFDGFFEKIIDEHLLQPRRDQERKTKDFVDIMLEFMESKEAEFRIDRKHVKAIMLDMLAASMDTASTSVEWALSELLKHPKAMKKVQNELEQVVGTDRMVEESDLENLKYLDMAVKESLRLHPAAPLLLPREATQDCTVNGYHIPRKARVTINVWAIGRDPDAWTDPEEFIPERFIGNSVDVRGRDFQLLPFGAGRRGCPGLQLGLVMVRLVVAQLVHCFDWELPEGMSPEELDMTEEFGLVTARAKHLLAIPTYRLNK